MPSMKNIVVLYHADCPDGFSGAWAAWKKLGNKADYIAQDRKTPLPKLVNKEIYFIDYAPRSARIVADLVKKNRRVVIIDHHLTAKPVVKSASGYLFDLGHSGAVLAWSYFHRKKPLSKLLKYIEDRDLWRWRLPQGRAVTNYIDLFDFSFKNWDHFAVELEDDKKFKKIIEKGKTISDYRQKIIKDMMGVAELVEFAGYRVLAVNAPSFLDSDLGHALVKKLPPLGIVWRRESGSINRFSLRGNGKINLAELAKKFGGGGHKDAAGFILPANKPLPWRSIRK